MRLPPRILSFLLVLVGGLIFPPSSPAAEKSSTPKPIGHTDAGAGANADEESEAEENEGPQRLVDRLKWFRQGRVGADGEMPFDARNRAFAQLDENIRRGILRGQPTNLIPGDGWSSVGPLPIYDNGNTFSGRITAIAIHPTNANTAYIGSAQGGVWKTTDHGANWTPLTDTQRSLSVGAVAIAPSNGNVIYVGTGEANSSCDSYFGVGILKSTDGGSTWTTVGATPFANTSISKIVVHPMNPNILWAANATGSGGFVCYAAPVPASVGVWKSLDGGTTWTRVLNAGPVHDLVINPTNPLLLYAGVDHSGIWRTPDGGTNWTLLTSGTPAAANIGRIALAISPSAPATLYALFADYLSGTQYGGTYKTTTNGTSWTLLTNKPSGSCQYWSFQDVCTYSGGSSGQCWYDLTIGVAADGGVWAGGTGIWRSGDGGSNWTAVCPLSVHPDQHALAFRGSDVWLGNDGGVFTTADNGASWTSRNPGLALTQFYPGGALHPYEATIALGGAQDNGMLYYSGAPGWTLLGTGDGAFNAIDRDNPSVLYTSTQYLRILKYNGFSWLNATSGLADSNTFNTGFISPFAMCPNDPQTLIAGSNNVWRTTNGAAFWSANSPDPLNSNTGAFVTALAFAPSTGDCSTYYAGDASGHLFRTTDAGGSWTDITNALPARAINDIAVDPTNPAIVIVGLSGFGVRHAWRSTNALAPFPNWFLIDLGIPDTPVNAVLIDPTAQNVLYLGTDAGIFRSTDGGVSWGVFMGGHPTVAVFDLVANAATGTILSYTHGRGVFKLGTFCNDSNACTTDTYDQVLGCQHGVVNCTVLDQCHVVGTCDAVTGCSNPARPDGTTCNDGNACTANDACVSGACLADPPPSCDDANACTSNACNTLTGACENPPIVCNDQNSCTDDGCNPTSGCVFTANDGNVCTDNSMCTSLDLCESGACVGQNPVFCAPDADVCTTEACDPATGGCITTNNSGPCDDQDVCTIGESCGPALNENFDTVATGSLPAAWTSEVIGFGSPWTTVSSSSDTAPNSAFGFDSPGVSDERLVTPPIAITSAAATLTFRNRWSFDDPTAPWGGGVLEISIGGGPFTDIVTAGGSFVSGGYNDVIFSFANNPLADRPAWARVSTGYPDYLTSVVILPGAAAGQIVQLQWRVGTDSCCSSVGQNIDSVVLLDGTNLCHPAAFVGCDDSNPCTDNGCNPTTGCFFTTDETNACDDGNPCTSGDTCDASAACAGVPVPPPGEVDDNVQLSHSGTTAFIQWSMAPNSTSSDILRGAVSALPVGPGGLDEVCFDDVPGTSTTDFDVPAAGTGYWYVIRGASACGNGGYGFEAVHGVPTVPRASATCP